MEDNYPFELSVGQTHNRIELGHSHQEVGHIWG